MQQACFKCSRLVLNAAVVFEMLHAWYALNAAVAFMGFCRFPHFRICEYKSPELGVPNQVHVNLPLIVEQQRHNDNHEWLL